MGENRLGFTLMALLIHQANEDGQIHFPGEFCS